MLPFSRYRISGHSMEPTLKDGQILWVNHWVFFFRMPKEGEVILFKKDNQEWVKRIKKIEGKKIYVLGDNQEDSLDSRKFSYLDKTSLLGKIIV